MARINEKIIEQINESKCSDAIKKFLMEVLSHELDNFEYGRWMFSKIYKPAIEKHSNDYKGD